MHAAASKNEMLSNDALRKIDREIAKYLADQKQSAVMAALEITQEEKGWLSGETMEAVACYLGIPPIAVYEVATFYNMYDLHPVGRHKLTVCTNLPCALSGGVHAADYLKQKLGIGFNETTADGRFTLKEGECMGACGDAPVNDGLLSERMAEAAIQGKLDEFLRAELPDSEQARTLAKMMLGMTGMMPADVPIAQREDTPGDATERRALSMPRRMC